MTYFELMTLPLSSLAWRTLNESLPIAARLESHDALNARLAECETAWAGFGSVAQAQILAALALDFSADGFTVDTEEKPDALAEMYTEMSHASHDSYIDSLCK